jgi:hypothetical protein
MLHPLGLTWKTQAYVFRAHELACAHLFRFEIAGH